MSGSRSPMLVGSGDDVEEVLVELAVGGVDPLRGPVHGPGDGPEVRARPVAAREDLVAVAGRVEEVDRFAAGDAVPGGAEVDRDVARVQQGAPVVDVVGEVVQLALLTLDEG